MMWLEKPGNRPNEEKSQPVVQAGAGTNSAVATVPPVAGQPGPSQDGWYGLPADAPKPAIAPFDADQAKQHQAEWAAYLKVPVEYTNSLGMKFRLIPPGEFMMGSTAEEIDRVVKAVPEEVSWTREFVKGEAPQHKVVLTQPIYVGINTVMQAEYEKLIGKNPSFFSKTGPEKQLVEKVAGLDTSNHPVEGVSWNDAVVFCVKLSEQDHLQPFYLADRETVTALEGNGYRLPSEAEWEFACRAGTETRYWSGDTDEDVKRVAWLAGTANDRTQPVGELPANPFGLHDVHGNVSQWIQDGWNVNAYGTSLDHLRIDPKPPFTTASSHVVRGGYWWGPEYYCRSAARNITDRNARTHSTGFRMVVTVDAVRQSLQQKSTNLSWHGWPADAPKPAIAPFDAGQAKAHQEGWAKYLKLPLEYETAGVKFHLIPPGEFRMGASESDADAQPYEKPQHVVSLTQPFYISTTELTVGQFQRFVDATKYVTEAESDGQGAFDISPRVRRPANVWNGKSSRTADADYPVRSVSWQDAGRYCEWLSQIAGRTARLPTEAEWEFACRAGTQTRYSFGDRVADIAHPPRGNGAPLSIVAQGPANPFGLFDMHGNVHELCLDSGRTYTTASEINPIGSVDPMTSPVVRGGAVSGDVSRMRSSHRYLNDQRQFPGLNFATMVKGFRVVLVPRFSNPAPTADQPK